MKTKRILTCSDFNEDGIGCCTSCHEDIEYGFPLIEDTLKTGEDIYVCCFVHNDLERQKKLKKD